MRTQTKKTQPIARAISLVMAFMLAVTLIPAGAAYATEESNTVSTSTTHGETGHLSVTAESNQVIKDGDYIQLAQYAGVPLKWQIINIEEGRALAFAAKNIAKMQFDAAGEDPNYHIDMDNEGFYSQSTLMEWYGSNNWNDSNIRQWLNSSSDIVPWTHCPPGYANTPGFLSSQNFSTLEKSLIKPVTHRTLVTYEDRLRGRVEGGTEQFRHNSGSISYIGLGNYQDAYWEWSDDLVFFLDPKELKEYVLDKEYPWIDDDYWLRGAGQENSPFGPPYRVIYPLIVNSSGYLTTRPFASSSSGVAPACYLDLPRLSNCIASGGGTRTDPYVIDADLLAVTPPSLTAIAVDEMDVLTQRELFTDPEQVNKVDISVERNGRSIGLYQLVQDGKVKYSSPNSSFSLSLAAKLTPGADVYLRMEDSSGAPVIEIKTGIVIQSTSLLQVPAGIFFYASKLTKTDAHYSYRYDESWFARSSKEYNHELARMSLSMSMAAFTSSITPGTNPARNIKSLFNQLEFSNISVHYPTPTPDSIGYALGSKTIIANETEYNLVAVAIRGAGYGQEWASNATVGPSSEHVGFARAASEVVSAIKSYTEQNSITKNTIIWITGYSRAAATANIAANRLNIYSRTNQIPGLSEDRIFAYCFECPQTTSYTGGSVDTNIHNIVNPIDIVTKVTPSGWGFMRYGTNYYTPEPMNSGIFATGSSIPFRLYQAYYDIAERAGVGNPDQTVTEVTRQIQAQSYFLNGLVDNLASFVGGGLTIKSGSNQYYAYSAYQRDLRNAMIVKEKGSVGSGVPGELFEAFLRNLGAVLLRFPVKTATAISSKDLIAFAHYPELCLAWMYAIDDKNGLRYASIDRAVSINCPVDVNVYDSNDTLVASVVDRVVQEVPGSLIGAFVDENNLIEIALPTDGDYRIEIIATGSGEVNYSIFEFTNNYDDATRVVNYFDVPVVEGDVLTGTAPAIEEVESTSETPLFSEVEYQLIMSGEEEAVAVTSDLSGEQVEHYSISVTPDGNGSVFGVNEALKGEFALLSATPNDSDSFIGWFDASDNLVSSDAEYYFRVESDITLTAKFTGVLVIPETYDLWISNINYDQRQALSGALDIELLLVNSGTMDIYSVDVVITGDSLGEVYRDTLPFALESFGGNQLELSIIVPTLESVENYTITVTPSGKINESADNIAVFSVGEFDFVVSGEEYMDDGVHMSDITVANYGSDMEAVLRIHADDSDGDILFEQVLGKVGMGESRLLSIDLDSLIEGLEIRALYAVISTPSGAESRSYENVTMLASFAPPAEPEESFALTVTDGIGSGDYTEGAYVTLIAMEADRTQRFIGWTISPAVTLIDGTSLTSPTVHFEMPAAAVAATANYEALSTYSVTYNSNDGTGSVPSSQTNLLSGDVVTIPSLPVPTRVGFTFGGWATTPTGTTPITSVTINNANVILYAIWKAGSTPAGTPPIINTSTVWRYLEDGMVGTAYPNDFYGVTQGTSPINWTIASGSLPPGLRLTNVSHSSWGTIGQISGTPTQGGRFHFVVKATNSAGSDTMSTYLDIYDTPRITTSTLANGTIGSSYSKTLAGASAWELSWTISSGSLPPGLSLSRSGVISGKPTSAGTYNFTVRATNAVASATKNLTIVVSSAQQKPSITTPFLTSGIVGNSYSRTIAASGGKPVVWSRSSGSLPPGLSLSSSGIISGKPTKPGAYTFVVKASNSAGSATKSFKITIAEKPKITTSATLDSGTIGVSYKKTLAATGTKAITWKRISGNLPPGLSLSSAGVITGKPTKSGTYSFKVRAINSVGRADKTFKIVIAQAGTIALSYTTHVQSVGWQDFVKEGEMSGTSGRALRLEGIKINLQNTTGISGGISYATHVQSIGWQSKVSLSSNGNNKTAVSGPMSGTSGRALRLEAITIELTGDLKKHYDIYYRVHAQKVGWMGWAKNGQEAGTAGHAYRLEGIQILLVPKVGGKAPGNVYKGITTPAGTPKFIKK